MSDQNAELVKAARDFVRTGDHDQASRLLARVKPSLTSIITDPRAPKKLAVLRRTEREEYVLLLRRATLEAEIAEHSRDYPTAKNVLQPFEAVATAALNAPGENDLRLAFADRDLDWRTVRQELYLFWQLSIVHYREGRVEESSAVLHRALRLAESLHPEVEGLLIQLYYGAAKLAFHRGAYDQATSLYGASFQSAERRLFARGKRHVVSSEEAAAARYSIGKTFALGLGQCLREQGRFEDARTVVIAGRLLLELTPDHVLNNYSGLLLGSIERGMAGESDPALLATARTRLDAAVLFFKDVASDPWFRAHYELALALMQAGEIVPARREIIALIKQAVACRKEKWIANGHIALSRIERRAGRFTQSVAAARKAAESSAGSGIERIARRARTTLALALYDRAVRGGVPDPVGLDDAEAYLGSALRLLEPNETRNRVMLLLVTAQIRLAKSDAVGAQEAYDEYLKIGHWVKSGRVREIGEAVRRELAVSMFRAPVDSTDDWDLENNRRAFDAYMLQRVRRRHPSAKTGALAEALGVTSKVFRNLVERVAEPEPPDVRPRSTKRNRPK